MKWRKTLLRLLLALGLIALLALGFRPRPHLVDGAMVFRGPMARTIEEEGKTRVAQRYLISAPLAGQVRRIQLEAGDEVAAGQVVAVLDAVAAPTLDARRFAEARARVAAADAALAAARKEAEAAAAAARYASAEENRRRELGRAGYLSASEVESIRAEAARSRALQRAADYRIQTLHHELEAARTALAYAGRQDPRASGRIELRAPVAGRVLKRYFESSQVVEAGMPILELGDPASLEVEVDVLSADAVRLRPGMPVQFERWGETEPLQGRVRRIEPGGFTKISALGVEEQRVLVIVDFTSPTADWQRLGDAYRVNARFILWAADEVLRVPTSALFRHRQGWAAFVVEDRRARLRPVNIGQQGGAFSEVHDGLTEGSTVIVHPGRDLADGDRVRLRQPPE